MGRMKVLVVSSVVPDARGSAGELVLHRHLEVNPHIQSEVVSWQRFPLRLKLIGKMRQLGFRSVRSILGMPFSCSSSAKLVHDSLGRFRPHVLLTVAHGWWHIGEKSREGIESPTGVFVPRLVAGFSGDSDRVRATCRTAISPHVYGE